MFVPLRLAADARNLKLTTTLDPRIDEVRAYLPGMSPIRLTRSRAGVPARRIPGSGLRRGLDPWAAQR